MNHRKRLLAITFFILGLFTLLIMQFYKIQIVEGEKWIRVANRQHYFIIKEPFLRGKFYSNTALDRAHPEMPQSFVFDVQKFHLHIDPDSIPQENRPVIANYLMTHLNMSVEEQMRCSAQFACKSRNRKIAMWLDRESRDQVMEWWAPYSRKEKIPRNALFFVSDYQRSYPFGKLLGQVLHTIQNSKNEKTGEAIPTGGLELHFDRYLRGKQGKRRLMRSPRNSFETGDLVTEPEHGCDIHVTINHNLQEIAEEEIAKGVEYAKAKSGWAVMIEPHTGAVLALAQYPFFYPGEYQRFFNEPEMIDHTRIKSITDANEPGSIMKPITMAIALLANEELKARGESPLFDPEEKMPTSDNRFPGRRKPLKDTHLHNFLNMDMALQKSSNVYVARLNERIINRLGNEWYRSTLQNVFGIGKKTKIELQSESGGLLPTPGKKHPNGSLEWSKATPFSMAMGHNIQISSLQMARAYCVFANGGKLVEPTLIRKIVKPNSDGSKEIVLDNTKNERAEAFPVVLSKAIVKRVNTAMKYVTKIGGSAPRADVKGYTEAGKTGTANKVSQGTYSQKLYSSSFVGFAPVGKPAFVLVVCIDEPHYGLIEGIGKMHHGGTCAAPVFREIARRSLEYLGVAPDDPHGYSAADPRFDAQKGDWIAETRQLKEMYDKWNKSDK